jgi:hypothetical protein
VVKPTIHHPLVIIMFNHVYGLLWVSISLAFPSFWWFMAARSDWNHQRQILITQCAKSQQHCLHCLQSCFAI